MSQLITQKQCFVTFLRVITSLRGADPIHVRSGARTAPEGSSVES